MRPSDSRSGTSPEAPALRRLPPGERKLAGGTQLWSLRVSGYALSPADDDVLDPDERQRAMRFVRPADRDRYRAAHVALRRLLGSYLDTPPDRVELTREPCPGCGGPHGRPAVAGTPLHFSLSHAGDLVLFGFAGSPIGVDVEEVPHADALADLNGALHPTERAELEAMPAPLRNAAFARCWTRKEACLKGTGIGLGDDPAALHVGAGPEPLAPQGWQLTDLAVADGYAAACAVRDAGSWPRTAWPSSPAVALGATLEA